MHHCTSWASEDNHLCHPHLCLHHHLQHNTGPAPDLLRPTGKCHEHPTHKKLPNPTCFSPIHPFHHSYLIGPHIWDPFRANCSQVHRQGLRHLSSPTHWRWPLHSNLLHGLSSSDRDQEKEHGQPLKKGHLHLLDCTPVPHIWGLWDVHSSGSHWVLLQTVNVRNAVLPHCNDLLLLRIWVLLELSFSLSSEQNHLKFIWGWLVEWQ